MRGYDRYDEYEDLDEYEENGDEQEEEDAGEDEYEEEEAHKPTKEVLDYLELRQRLKEEKRKKLKKELGTANGSSREQKNVIPKDSSYGSFFGPSQPVISQRVIQESKSLLENPNLAARISKSNQNGNKITNSALSASKSQASGHRPKVTNGLQKKVEMLKSTRDYSFLLSDDAELPIPPKRVPPRRNISAPKPEASSAQLSERSRDSLSNKGRKFSSSREDKKPTATVNQMQPKSGSQMFASGGKPIRPSIDSRKHLGGNNGTLADHRKQLSSNNGSAGWPVVSKSVPPKAPVGTADKKVSVPVARTSAPGIHKPNPSKLHAPVSKQSSARKEEYQTTGKPKILPKQPVPPPKPKQVMRPPPKTSARDTSRDERPRKRPVRHDDDDDDAENAISMIRKMFGYNPKRYEDVDDDSDMEANFDDILREERRSARIARQEDEEELRKIEEEERRERLRKEAKQRKLSHR